MWGFGGRYYWGRKESVRIEGIAVIFAWMSSKDRHLKSYVNLYSSLGWNSLVCHSQFLNMFFPDKATPIASVVLNELVKELKERPCPVVFVAFSGGPKACMCNVLKIIEGTAKARCNPDDYRLVRKCISGFIYDSSPVDFTSDLGVRFLLHPTVLKSSHPSKLSSWAAKHTASILDVMFFSKFELLRSEYWQTLYSSASHAAPYLFLCSETDDLARYETVCNFARRLKELGAFVDFVKWHDSPHVGHYRSHPIAYKAAVAELLRKAVVHFTYKIHHSEPDKMGSEGMHGTVSGPAMAAAGLGQDSWSLNLEPSGPLPLLDTTPEHPWACDAGSFSNERKEGEVVHVSGPPRLGAHGVLGQVLFDVCVPRNVEGWEMRLGARFPSSRGHSAFNPIKCILRSRL